MTNISFIVYTNLQVNMRNTRITRVRAFVLLNIKTTYLIISYNTLVTIHPKAFWTNELNNKTKHTELKYLYLSNNYIEYIKSGTFDPLVNLELLYLNNNGLSNIDNKFIVNLNKLTFFSISDNQLTQLPTKWLPNSLIELDISSNSIAYVSMHTFERAPNLNKIILSLNKTTIEYNTFSNLTKLSSVIAYPRNIECTCKYIWYINTKSDHTVCDNSNNKYASIREYLKEECKLPG